MGYAAALDKAWKRLETAGFRGTEKVRFFGEEFRADAAARSVLDPSGKPVNDFVSILLLHYLEKRLTGLPAPSGEWVSFKELEGGEQYYPAFRKRAIEPLLKKYAGNPRGIFHVLEKIPSARKAGQADAGVIVDAFEAVPVQVEIWGADEELPADAAVLFDRSISAVFCTEDVAVLAGFCAKYI